MSAPQNIDEFIEKFTMIAQKGWIKTHRAGPTGIGKTLEDLLEITENNSDGPDFGEYELKAMRTSATSMLTLFTKTPKPPKVNSVLLNTYGFSTDNYYNEKKVLHTTLLATRFSNLGNTGKSLKIKCVENKISIIDNHGNEPAYWNANELEKAFLKKYKYRLVHVFADSTDSGLNEHFKFHTAWELYDFNFENMLTLLKEGLLKIDIRIGQYPNGSPHDHGTGFRIEERYLTKMFKNKRILIQTD
ncbi:MvaI/BcnI family restriction endonuclease [Treponema sp.]|uniref:MvaI/BcnI family restriction endonuclease n=1 Tax=Treponema sp. TaxID=166 RepID=UPI003FA2113D